MKKIIVLIIILIACAVYAEDRLVYPVNPYTGVRDYSKPAYIVEDHGKSWDVDIDDETGKVYHPDEIYMYPTTPGSDYCRDYDKPSLVIRGDKIYQTIPGQDMIDYSKPAFKVEELR